MSELELVDPCVGCPVKATDDCYQFCCNEYSTYQARKEERTISGPEFYAQGFEAGVQAERERVVEWLGNDVCGNETIENVYKRLKATLKGESDAK